MRHTRAVAGKPKGLNACRARLIGILLTVVVLSQWPLSLAAQGVDQAAAAWHIEAERWEEAEKIFHCDPRWLGGDGATAIDLTAGRVLWLFGDSFIDVSGTGSRKSSALARNSIAIQSGYDPVRRK